MKERRLVSTGTAWEARNGYSRVVRVGPHVWTAGTLPTNDAGDVVHADSPYRQTLAALEKLERAMGEVGATRADVVRTRLYVTQIRFEAEVGRAHKEFFGDAMPCATMVEVAALASPLAMIEVEVEAYVGADRGGVDDR